MIKLDYKMKKLNWNKSSIKDFYSIVDTRRKIRNAQVNSIYQALKRGENFSAPCVVNKKKNNKYKIVDSNHRYEAVVKMLAEDPNFEIEVEVAIYEDLNDEQERAVYTKWNKQVRQSATDFIQANWDTFPMKNRLLNELPLTVYGSKTCLPVKTLVGNQIVCSRHYRNIQTYDAGTDQVVADFRALTPEDIDTLKEFVKFIEKVLGKYKAKADFYTGTSIAACYKIWYDNKDLISETRMVTAFKKVLDPIKNKSLWEDSKAGGRNATYNFYSSLLDRLNRISTKKFLSDIQAHAIYEKNQLANQKMGTILKVVNKT